MKVQKLVSLASKYRREEDFSLQLSNHILHLGVGEFEDAETETYVGTRRADIVAKSSDGILVIENQFGQADWDHWGRLEAFARLKEAAVAVLVAEEFEELMIVTCNLRNEDSNIDWYLIKVQLNDHDEFSFTHVARPAIDIQAEKKGIEYSEFWEPVRKKGLFAGKPVPVRDDSWVSKDIKGISVLLRLHKSECSVLLQFRGDDRIERRESVSGLFEGEKYEFRQSSKFANILFPIMKKGKEDREYWMEIREKLVAKGTEIYNRIMDSNL